MSRLRNPATGRTYWWAEAVILVSVYYLYTATRGVADSSEARAIQIGWDILHLQEALHLDIELALNRWLHSVPVLAVICCYYYATLHFVVTPGVLFWMHRRHPASYSRARWTIVLTTLICLVGFFLFPTAPPRLLPGAPYTDTMAYYENWGWWSGNASAAPDGLDGLANQYAAMPSLHCAWALWCGVLLVRFARRPVVRVLGALYPGATLFVVMATSNHYILDGFVGWAVLGMGTVLAFRLTAWRAGRARGAACPDGAVEGVVAGSAGSAEEAGEGSRDRAPAVTGQADGPPARGVSPGAGPADPVPCGTAPCGTVPADSTSCDPAPCDAVPAEVVPAERASVQGTRQPQSAGTGQAVPPAGAG